MLLQELGNSAAAKRAALPPEVVRILKERDRLFFQDGVLFRRRRDPKTGEDCPQLVLPGAYKQQVWTTCHEQAGHFGREKTLSFIRSRFYWAGQTKDVFDWCAACSRCTLRKMPSTSTKAPLVPIETTYPLELVTMDFLKLHPSTSGHQYVLVMTDHFTKYSWVVPTKDQTAATTARAMWSNVIRFFGSPSRFHADQGANFESAVVRELCELYGAKKSHTTSYHPQGNGNSERFNRTLLQLLGTLDEDRKPHWPDYIEELLLMYNNTVHCSTGQTPSYLLFGWHPRLPLDLVLGTPVPNVTEPSSWVQRHHQRLCYAHQKAKQVLEAARKSQKQKYDQAPLSFPLLPGERVLLKQRGAKDCGKLADNWEKSPYIVVRQPNPDIPVYVVKPDKGEGTEKVVHRNFLRSCPVNYEVPTEAQLPVSVVEKRGDVPWWGMLSVPGELTEPGALENQSAPLQPRAHHSEPNDIDPSEATDPILVPRRSQRTTLGQRPARYASPLA